MFQIHFIVIDFLNKNNNQKTIIGIAYAQIFIFIQKPAISQAQVVVQIFDQRIIQRDCTSVINSALKKDIVSTATRELDCINDEALKPKIILFQVLLVLFCNIFSRVQPVKFLNHCCKNIIQNKNIATQADISLKSGLIQNQ